MSLKVDLPIRKGTQIVQPVLVTQDGETIALPGGTAARMQIRTSVDSATVKAELTTANGQLVVDTGAAKVTINMSSAFTATLDFERGVYDLHLIYPSNESELIVEGKVFVFPSVTR